MICFAMLVRQEGRPPRLKRAFAVVVLVRLLGLARDDQGG